MNQPIDERCSELVIIEYAIPPAELYVVVMIRLRFSFFSKIYKDEDKKICNSPCMFLNEVTRIDPSNDPRYNYS
jgi:hypothetical protein